MSAGFFFASRCRGDIWAESRAMHRARAARKRAACQRRPPMGRRGRRSQQVAAWKAATLARICRWPSGHAGDADAQLPWNWSEEVPVPWRPTPYAARRTACSRHRRWRSVRRDDATGSSRPLPLRMDLWTKSRLRILLGVIGRTSRPAWSTTRRRSGPSCRTWTPGPDTSNRMHASAQQLSRWAQDADVVEIFRCMNHQFRRCQCGAIRGYVALPAKTVRAICYCRDCQAFARYLERAGDVLDEHGGTDIVATAPSHVRFEQGLQHPCLHVSIRHRNSAVVCCCCRTPFRNTPRDRKTHYVGLIHSCLAEQPLNASFGPARIRLNTKSARGSVSAPRSAQSSQSSSSSA